MDRRSVILGAVASALAFPARANKIALGPPTPMGIPMRVFVSQPTIIRQDCPDWCWAASTAMIFASNGRALPNQEIIIERVFQAQPLTQTCTTASPNTITKLLNDNWLDAAGRGFKSRILAGYDIYSGQTNINNNIIVNELSNNRPLLYCNKHHAMVIVAMEYFDTPMGPNPQNVWVMDPWPTSPPFHPLSPQEMMPAHMGGDYCYSAAVVIS
jgi:hypothetical protein